MIAERSVNHRYIENIVIYTFSDLKDECKSIINNLNVKILCIDKNEYVKMNDHKIYIYASSIFEKNEKKEDLRFKIIKSYLKEKDIWISDCIDKKHGLVKVLKKNKVENFYSLNRKKIENARVLIRDKETYDDFIYSRESGNFLFMAENKAKYSQYNHPIIKAEEGDIIVDGGTYDFKSAYVYLARTDFKSYCHCFEANMNNIDYDYIKRKNIEKYITINNKALYNVDDLDLSVTDTKYSSTVGSVGNVNVKSIKLDTYFKDKEYPTLIKLDIEGAEIEAIKGMADILKNKKPKLQIAVYHNSNDIFEIPLLLNSINNEYHDFHLGYHSNYGWCDRTILYG